MSENKYIVTASNEGASVGSPSTEVAPSREGSSPPARSTTADDRKDSFNTTNPRPASLRNSLRFMDERAPKIFGSSGQGSPVHLVSSVRSIRRISGISEARSTESKDTRRLSGFHSSGAGSSNQQHQSPDSLGHLLSCNHSGDITDPQNLFSLELRVTNADPPEALATDKRSVGSMRGSLCGGVPSQNDLFNTKQEAADFVSQLSEEEVRTLLIDLLVKKPPVNENLNLNTHLASPVASTPGAQRLTRDVSLAELEHLIEEGSHCGTEHSVENSIRPAACLSHSAKARNEGKLGGINQYAFIRKLGEGRQGVVMLARNTDNQEMRAIKIISRNVDQAAKAFSASDDDDEHPDDYASRNSLIIGKDDTKPEDSNSHHLASSRENRATKATVSNDNDNNDDDDKASLASFNTNTPNAQGTARPTCDDATPPEKSGNEDEHSSSFLFDPGCRRPSAMFNALVSVPDYVSQQRRFSSSSNSSFSWENSRHKEMSVEDQKREFDILKTLRHRNVVTIHEFIDDADDPNVYLVMDYISEGPVVSLDDQTGQCAPLGAELIVAYISKLASALQFVHSRGVLHRDVKPDNLLVNAEGEIFLSDFGISKAAGRAHDSKLSTVVGWGTMAFLSPQQIGAVAAESPADDMWAFGVSLYAMTYGRLPFWADNFTDLRNQILANKEFVDQPKPAALNSEWNQIVSEVIRALLTVDPEKRATPQQVRRMLFNWASATNVGLSSPMANTLSIHSPGSPHLLSKR